MLTSKTFYDSENKIWFGYKVPPIFHPDVSFGQIALHMLGKNSDKLCQISASTGNQYTCLDMRNLSIKAAKNLQYYGIKQLDVIGLVASNSDNLAPLVFGALTIGAPISTLDPSFTKDEIKHVFGISKPKVIFSDPGNYSDVEAIVQELKLDCEIFLLKGHLSGVKTVQEFLKETEDDSIFIAPKLIEGGDQTAAILCSSGTTGLPKGVCLSHKMLLRQTMTNLTPSDVLFGFSSLYWLSGVLVLAMGTVCGGLRVIIDEPFSVNKFFEIVETYKVTFVFTPPSQIALLVQKIESQPKYFSDRLASIEVCLCAGSAVPEILSNKMKNYLKNGTIFVGYGMTEICGLCTIETSAQNKSGSTGQIVPNLEVKIVDELNNSLGIDEKGEILIRTSFCWKGYYTNEEATRAAYDQNGWIHSGDIGYFDANGFLFVVDRIKDILKCKNFPIFPNEIEAVILELKDVIEVSVCGLPDLVYTDIPAAAVITRNGSNLTEQDICDHVARRMHDCKKLRGGAHFFKELPKTASGKVKRQKIREILMEKK